MPVEYLTPAIEDRAVELLTLLADRGQHCAPPIPDAIIAATAGLTVLHLDRDFDLIAHHQDDTLEQVSDSRLGVIALVSFDHAPDGRALEPKRVEHLQFGITWDVTEILDR